MRRRVFIAGLLGAAAAWPLTTARAQQPARPVIGYLSHGPIDGRPHLTAAFRKGLAAQGFVEGQNVTIEYRSANGRTEDLAELAADLVRGRVAVLTAIGPPAALAAQRAAQTIPIVFGVSADPVKMGLVPSINRPGGNSTGVYGFLTEVGGKRLGMMHEMLPAAKRVAVLVNPHTADNVARTVADVTSAATSRSSMPAPRRRSTRPSRRWPTGGPTPCLSAPTRYSPASACSSSRSRHAMHFRHSTLLVSWPRSAA